MALFDLSWAVDALSPLTLTITRATNNRTLDTATGKFSAATTTTLEITGKLQPLSKAAIEALPEGRRINDSMELHTTTRLYSTRRDGAGSDETAPSDSFDYDGSTYEIVGSFGPYLENGNFYKYLVSREHG
jgi:hypothetical protein